MYRGVWSTYIFVDVIYFPPENPLCRNQCTTGRGKKRADRQHIFLRLKLQRTKKLVLLLLVYVLKLQKSQKQRNQSDFVYLFACRAFFLVLFFILKPRFDLRLVILQTSGRQQSVIAVGTTEEKGQDVRHIYRAEETSTVSQSPLSVYTIPLRLLSKQKHLLLKSSDAADSVCSPNRKAQVPAELL